MKRLRIVVVEDDAMIAFLLGEILSGMGHDVCALEGTEDGAIASALRCKPDLMIVDEHLGGGSGLNVVDAVQADAPVLHFFVTGDARRIRTLRPHAVTVEKPYSEGGLAWAIHKVMDPGSGSALSHRENATRVRAALPTRQVGSPGASVANAGIRPERARGSVLGDRDQIRG
jgi:DNA-binding response OmpR family regulator